MGPFLVRFQQPGPGHLPDLLASPAQPGQSPRGAIAASESLDRDVRVRVAWLDGVEPTAVGPPPADEPSTEKIRAVVDAQPRCAFSGSHPRTNRWLGNDGSISIVRPARVKSPRTVYGRKRPRLQGIAYRRLPQLEWTVLASQQPRDSGHSRFFTRRRLVRVSRPYPRPTPRVVPGGPTAANAGPASSNRASCRPRHALPRLVADPAPPNPHTRVVPRRPSQAHATTRPLLGQLRSGLALLDRPQRCLSIRAFSHGVPRARSATRHLRVASSAAKSLMRFRDEASRPWLAMCHIIGHGATTVLPATRVDARPFSASCRSETIGVSVNRAVPVPPRLIMPQLSPQERSIV